MPVRVRLRYKNHSNQSAADNYCFRLDYSAAQWSAHFWRLVYFQKSSGTSTRNRFLPNPAAQANNTKSKTQTFFVEQKPVDLESGNIILHTFFMIRQKLCNDLDPASLSIRWPRHQMSDEKLNFAYNSQGTCSDTTMSQRGS